MSEPKLPMVSIRACCRSTCTARCYKPNETLFSHSSGLSGPKILCPTCCGVSRKKRPSASFPQARPDAAENERSAYDLH